MRNLSRACLLLPLFTFACSEETEDSSPVQDMAITQDAALKDLHVIFDPDVLITEDLGTLEDVAVVDRGPEEDLAPLVDLGGAVDAWIPPEGDEFSVECSVPYVLDGARVDERPYMEEHFDHLIQEYCVKGKVDGDPIDGAIEKMYYGSHDPRDPILYFNQISMDADLNFIYSVKMDFWPDEEVREAAAWDVGLLQHDAKVAILRHQEGAPPCIIKAAVSGRLTFSNVSEPQALEGGRFDLNGVFEVVDPQLIPSFCNQALVGDSACCEAP